MIGAWRAVSGSPRPATRLHLWTAALAVFVLSFLYVLPTAADLIDDHFMHVAWGRQTLKGRLPVRDMVSLGMPLQSGISAAAERVVGYRLLSEAVVIGTAFALGGVLTFLLARRASGSIAVGVVAAALVAAVSPRTYSYPKIVVYTAAILLLWHYIDRASRGAALLLGAAVGIAFYLRHDHGLYLAILCGAVLFLRHYPDWRVLSRRLGLAALVAILAVAPFLLFVQRHWGVGEWMRDLRSLSRREYHQNRFETWPRWPLGSIRDVVQWSPQESLTAVVGVRWSRDASDAARQAAAARYGLRVPDDAPLDSGRFVLTDISRQNAIGLVNDPAVDDTAGIDKQSGDIDIPGFRVGALHLLPGVDTAPESAALLFYLIVGLLLATMLALHPRSGVSGHLGARERLLIGTVALVTAVTTVAFIREPLAIRIADALVAPIILLAWWTGVGLRGARKGVLAALLLLLIGRSVAVVGNTAARLEGPEDLATVGHQLWASPPFDGWAAVGSAKYEAVRYVRTCTGENEPLLVLWFAPDLYYYADRPFAGRLGFYMEGYWTSPVHQRLNVAAIDRDRPTIALIEAGRETTDLYTYPMVLDYLDRHYRPIGELTSADGRIIRVLAREDRTPVSVDPAHGWPCYR